MKARFLLILIAALFTQKAFAQLDNSRFYETGTKDSLEQGQFSLKLDYTGFLRNNEYFTKIAEGYTLFGTHLLPVVQYQVHPDFRLEAGAFFWKNFGENGIHQIEPVFTARFHKNSNQILMGTLEGGLAHNLIEPLYDFENQFLRRLENGFQWKHTGNKFKIDTWVDWRNMIFQNSNQQEEIVGGVNLQVPILKRNLFKLNGIIQGTAFHMGGQIDTTNLPLKTWFNGAAGMSLSWDFEEKNHLQQICFQGFALGFNDNSNKKELPFTSGDAVYLNFLVKTKWLDLMTSYWSGNHFTTWQGGKLYRSISSNKKEPGYFEAKREIIIIRLLKDFKIAQNIFISARLEPYYDLSNKFWEFSHGLFFTYRGNILKSK